MRATGLSSCLAEADRDGAAERERETESWVKVDATTPPLVVDLFTRGPSIFIVHSHGHNEKGLQVFRKVNIRVGWRLLKKPDRRFLDRGRMINMLRSCGCFAKSCGHHEMKSWLQP